MVYTLMFDSFQLQHQYSYQVLKETHTHTHTEEYIKDPLKEILIYVIGGSLL